MSIATIVPTTAVSYGSFDFSEELLYSNTLSINDNPIRANGSVDKFSTQITLNGIIAETGGLELINATREGLISGLAAESFVDLSIDGKTFPLTKVDSVSFPDGDYSSFLPYSISFSSTTEHDFTLFSGISSPEDNWQFSSDNLVGTAIHTISAIGEKNSIKEPLENAIDFVTGRRGGNINSISAFHQTSSPENYVLVNTSETIDRFAGSYSIVDTYNFMEIGSYNLGTEPKIIKCKIDSDYSKDAGLSVNVNGSVSGPIIISGLDLVSGTDFTFEDASGLAGDFLTTSYSEGENYQTSDLVEESFSYTKNESGNNIDFSFTLVEQDPNDLIEIGQNKVLNETSTSVKTSKEGGSVVELTINGKVTYFGKDNPVLAGEEEDSIRWVAIESAFNGLDIFALAKSKYDIFKGQVSNIYSMPATQTLSPKALNYSINKDLKGMNISYSYTYNDKFDYASQYPNLKNVKLSITDKRPFLKKSIKQTIVGFSSSDLYSGVGVISAKGSADMDSGEFGNLQIATDTLIANEGYFVVSSSKDYDEDTMSYGIERYYE